MSPDIPYVPTGNVTPKLGMWVKIHRCSERFWVEIVDVGPPVIGRVDNMTMMEWKDR